MPQQAGTASTLEPGKGAAGFFIPDLCGARPLFILVLVSQLLAFVLVLSGMGGAADFMPRLGLVSMYVQWVALASAAILCASRPLLARCPVWLGTLLALSMVIAVSVLVSVAGWRLLVEPDGGGLYRMSLVQFMSRNLAITLIVAALALRYLYVSHHWQQQLRADAESRIAALQARIRPHFLFNSMNTIAALIRSQPEAAEQAVEDLAELFRASLTDHRERVPLGEELRICQLYARLEGLRLGSRLHLEWRFEGVPDNLQVLPLCLQPLVENAIYHGVAQIPEGGTVAVGGDYVDGRVRLYVRNPVPANGERQRGQRMALENIRQRLELTWGRQASLEQQYEDRVWDVSLVFPAEYAGSPMAQEVKS